MTSLYRWLPKTIPGVRDGGVAGSPTFDRMIATAEALEFFLVDEDFPFIITSLFGQTKLLELTCGADGNKAFAATQQRMTNFVTDPCPGVQGYITICSSALRQLADRFLVDENPNKPLDQVCTEENRLKLNKVREPGDFSGFNWEGVAGARGSLILHEMLHLQQVGKQAGWGTTKNAAGQDVQVW
jgi:hypothetical protein